MFYIILFSAASDEILVFSDVPTTIFARPLIKEIYEGLGITIDFQEFPPERALQSIESGIADGYSLAFPIIAEVMENIIIVPEYLYKEPVVAYIKKGRDIKIDGWDSLSSYSVGIVRGHKVMEINTEKLKYRHIIDTPLTMFIMLQNNRIDIALFYPSFILTVLDTWEYKDFIALAPPLTMLPVHTFLHKKHAGLVPNVSDRIREMKESGRMDEILYNFLGRKRIEEE